MEAVAHGHLDHAPSSLTVDLQTDLTLRTDDRQSERERHWFGSAVLVSTCGYVFRINICGCRKPSAEPRPPCTGEQRIISSTRVPLIDGGRADNVTQSWS